MMQITLIIKAWIWFNWSPKNINKNNSTKEAKLTALNTMLELGYPYSRAISDCHITHDTFEY